MMHITEDTPPDMLEGAMDLTVHLPNGRAVKMSVERSTPMMDVLVQITTSHQLQISNYGIHALGMAPLSGHSDKILPFKANTPIGTLETQHIRVVPKSRSVSASRIAPISQQPFESTFRLKVHLPRNQLYVHRVSKSTNLGQIMRKVCDEKNLDPEKYEFRHPGNLDEVLDPKLTLADYQITEIYAVLKGTARLSQTFSTQDIMALRKEDDRKNSKSSGGVFSLFFKRGKSNSGSLSSENRSISPSHSDDSRSGTPPATQPPLEKPKPPQRKRRPAPKPPQIKEESKKVDHPVTICHSRNSSDSSGYHEASILSDANASLPRRPQIISEENRRSLNGEFSRSTGNLATISTQFKSTSSLALAGRKKKAPPPPPKSAAIENASPVVASRVEKQDLPSVCMDLSKVPVPLPRQKVKSPGATSNDNYARALENIHVDLFSNAIPLVNTTNPNLQIVNNEDNDDERENDLVEYYNNCSDNEEKFINEEIGEDFEKINKNQEIIADSNEISLNVNEDCNEILFEKQTLEDEKVTLGVISDNPKTHETDEFEAKNCPRNIENISMEIEEKSIKIRERLQKIEDNFNQNKEMSDLNGSEEKFRITSEVMEITMDEEIPLIVNTYGNKDHSILNTGTEDLNEFVENIKIEESEKSMKTEGSEEINPKNPQIFDGAIHNKKINDSKISPCKVITTETSGDFKNSEAGVREQDSKIGHILEESIDFGESCNNTDENENCFAEKMQQLQIKMETIIKNKKKIIDNRDLETSSKEERKETESEIIYDVKETEDANISITNETNNESMTKNIVSSNGERIVQLKKDEEEVKPVSEIDEKNNLVVENEIAHEENDSSADNNDKTEMKIVESEPRATFNDLENENEILETVARLANDNEESSCDHNKLYKNSSMPIFENSFTLRKNPGERQFRQCRSDILLNSPEKYFGFGENLKKWENFNNLDELTPNSESGAWFLGDSDTDSIVTPPPLQNSENSVDKIAIPTTNSPPESIASSLATTLSSNIETDTLPSNDEENKIPTPEEICTHLEETPKIPNIDEADTVPDSKEQVEEIHEELQSWQYQLPSPPKAFRDDSPVLTEQTPTDSIITSPELFEKLKLVKETQSETSEIPSVASEEDMFNTLSLENLEKRKSLVYNRELATSFKFTEEPVEPKKFENANNVITELEEVLANKPEKIKVTSSTTPITNNRVETRNLPNFKITTYNEPKQNINIFEDDSIRSNANDAKLKRHISMENLAPRRESLDDSKKQSQDFNKYRSKTLARTNEGLARSESLTRNTWVPLNPVKRSKSQVAINYHQQKSEEEENTNTNGLSKSNSLFDVSGLQSLEVMRKIQTKLNSSETKEETTTAFKSGPPSINLGTWSDRPKSSITSKNDPTTNNNNNNVSIKINGSESISTRSGNNVIIKIGGENNVQLRKPLDDVKNKVERDMSRVPIVRSVELKKPFRDFHPNKSVTQICPEEDVKSLNYIINNNNKINRINSFNDVGYKTLPSKIVTKDDNNFSTNKNVPFSQCILRRTDSVNKLENNNNNNHNVSNNKSNIFGNVVLRSASNANNYSKRFSTGNIDSVYSQKLTPSFNSVTPLNATRPFSKVTPRPISQVTQRPVTQSMQSSIPESTEPAPQTKPRPFSQNVPRPPPPPALPKPKQRPATVAIDPRGQLLSDIINFGGKKGLRTVNK